MSSSPFYTTITEIRAEGADPGLTDEFIQGRIEYASRCLDTYTGRWFYARPASYKLDGNGTPILPVPDPIVGIDEVAVLCSASFGSSGLDTVLDPGEYVVYNRHLREGMTGEPDDREAPRIEIQGYGESDHTSYRFRRLPSSNQRIRVTGRFGYTDPVPACARSSSTEPFALVDGDTLSISVDGAAPEIVTFETASFVNISQASALEVVTVINLAGVSGLRADVSLGTVFLASNLVGSQSSLELIETTVNDPVFGYPSGVISFPDGLTPLKIRRATMLMVFRDLDPIGERGDRWYQSQAHRITKLKTRDQEIGLSAGSTSAGSGLAHQTTGYFTGDPEIDNIIAMYSRPPEVGFVGGVDHNTVSPHGLYPDYFSDPYGDYGVGYPLYGLGPY
jgi:hypothetical protein